MKELAALFPLVPEKQRNHFYYSNAGPSPMRFLLLTLLGVLTCTMARSELYVQDESRSPDDAVVFAISYPPTEKQPEGFTQGCFLHSKSKKRIGDFFFLPSTDAEADHPGTYPFDNYNVFDYVWSADSTHIAIVHNMRHFGVIHPFRRSGSSFQRLQMPDLVAPLQKRLAGAINQSIHTSIHANCWQQRHRLVATIAKEAQVTDTGNESKDWREHSLQFTISFDSDAQPTVEAAQFQIKSQP